MREHVRLATAVGSGSAVYANRSYRCIVAGTMASVAPVYDTTFSAQTADGSAIFEAEEVWTRSGIVQEVADRSTFTASVDEPRAVDGWFAGGLVTWESGGNTGRSVEVSAWTQASGEIALFLPMGFAMEPGDMFAIRPGCDKRLTTCIARFANALNFRGEPYVPGQDSLMTYPDVR